MFVNRFAKRPQPHHWMVLLGAGLVLVALGFSVNAVRGQDEPPLPLYDLPVNRSLVSDSSNTIAIGTDNLTLVATNMLSDSISLISPGLREVTAEIPVGREPRSVTITQQNDIALVVNRGDVTLSVVDLDEAVVVNTIPLGGVMPYGVVSDGGTTAYVSLQGMDMIAVVNTEVGVVTERIPVPDAPAGLALWGDFLYVTHFWSGDVSMVYLPESRVVATVSTGADSSLSQFVEVSAQDGIAFVPQSRSNASNPNLTYDTIVMPVVNVLDLESLRLVRADRVTPDTADRPVNMPFVTAFDRARNFLYVANAGSNDISVIDLDSGLAEAHIEVGTNPRGMVLNRDNTRLFVHNVLDGTVTFINTDSQTVLDVLPITNINIPVDVLLGMEFFYTSDDARITTDSWLSCASCHYDGQSDGRVWVGFADGPRNTQVLYNLLETAPYNWSATWDELADTEVKIRSLMAGEGLIGGPVFPTLADPHSGLSVDLDALTEYLLTLQGPPNPTTLDSDLVERGALVFGEQGCAECHEGAAGTNLQSYDVGTGVVALEAEGTAIDTPTLRWLWMSAPYFHDGSAETLEDVFILPGKHQLIGTVPPEDIDALVAYLLSWQSGDLP